MDELHLQLRSPQALGRAVATLLDWARTLVHDETDIEVAVEGPAGRKKPLGEFAEEDLYALRFAIEVLIAVQDRLVLRGYANLQAGEKPEHVVRDAAAALRKAVEDTGVKDHPTDPVKLAELCRWVAGESGRLQQGQWPADGYGWLWVKLADLGERLGQAASSGSRGYRYLWKAARQGMMLQALVAMEVLFGPLRPDPLSETASLGFHMISAANRSPFDADIFGKRPDQPPIGAEKLAGNQLNNFAAFLSARWRHNDWIWGRLDAARSLVELLARPDRIPNDEDLRALLTELGAPSDDRDRKALVDGLVRLLHQQILDEELHLLEKLDDDRPTPDLLKARENQKATNEQKRLLGAIGLQTVRERLASRRRPLARAGLVLWRTLQPKGESLAMVVRVACGLLKPLVVPLLGAVLAWRWVLGASVAWFASATLLTGDGWTWGHVPLVVSAVVCLVAGIAGPAANTAQPSGPTEPEKDRSTCQPETETVQRKRPAWVIPVGVFLFVVLVESLLLERPKLLGFGPICVRCWMPTDWLVNSPGIDGGDLAAAALAAVGALLAAFWLAPARGAILALVVAAAATTLGLAWLAAQARWEVLRQVLGPVFTYTQLGLLTFLLTWWFPGGDRVTVPAHDDAALGPSRPAGT